jgi:exonuclease III
MLQKGSQITWLTSSMASQRPKSKNWIVLHWNMRGLNNDDKKKAVRAKIEENSCSIFCIQETKIDSFDCSSMKKITPKRFSKFTFMPSIGA